MLYSNFVYFHATNGVFFAKEWRSIQDCVEIRPSCNQEWRSKGTDAVSKNKVFE